MTGKYNFIQLENVRLRNFSLYSKSGKIHEVNEDINSGVYCLAGANGLGKTTFLNAINYGLTGIVLEPGRTMFAPGEIVRENKVFTDSYFSGRIHSKDKEKAEIEITFSVNGKYFKIIKGFFEREELRLFQYYRLENKKVIHLLETDKKNSSQLNALYQRKLAEEIGFDDFEYFLFYQLYVLTFDESRRMIFWDDRASSNALAIAFNADPSDANKVSDIVRKMEKHESNGRNIRWQATQIKNKIDELSKRISKKQLAKLEQLEDEYKELFEDADKYQNLYENSKIQLDTLFKKQSHLNSDILLLRREHTKLFSQYSKPRSRIMENLNIQLSMEKHECCVCGTKGNYIVDSIQKNIHKDSCPLCNTPINDKNATAQDKLLKTIEKNDKQIAKKTEELEALFLEIEGKTNEVDKAELQAKNCRKKLKEFESEYPEISPNGTGDKNVDAMILQLKEQYDALDEESKNEYKKRDKLKPEHEKLLARIEKSYKDGEKYFVPTFKKLAKSFIGYDLNIRLKKESKSLKLILELRDTARTESTQLSESQRFFLDIALRMALSIYLSKKNSPSSMLIDTPEGSLDIAYESRVGQMFAEFVNVFNQNIFMTANINASQLLISLAERCGNKQMKFRRMWEWTDLSTIQKEGEGLFKGVYSIIEKALNKKK